MIRTIARSNNRLLKEFSLMIKINRKLQSYFFPKQSFQELSDAELIKKLLEQVSCLPLENSAGKIRKSLAILKSGHIFRSERVGLLIESLASVGLVAREISLWGKDCRYQACEVWSDFYKKWIFVDPNKGTYCTQAGRPLSFYSFWAAKQAGRLKEITISCVNEDIVEAEFYANLMDYLGVGSKEQLILGLDKKEEFYAEDIEICFVQSPYDLYYPINRVSVSYQALAEGIQYGLKHNMPWFSFYELFEDEQWKAIKKDYFLWEREASLQIRAVNKVGRRGPITQIEPS